MQDFECWIKNKSVIHPVSEINKENHIVILIDAGKEFDKT